MKAQLTVGVVVILVMALVVLMSLHDWTESGDIQQDVLNEMPIIVSHQVAARFFDEAGQVKYRMKAERAAEFDKKERLELELPQVEVFQGKQHWVINAQQGVMEGQGRDASPEIVLTGKVHAQQVNAPSSVLSSEELHYWPKEQRLVSPGEIMIRQQQNSTRAGRLEANLDDGRLQLKGGVESVYAVPAS